MVVRLLGADKTALACLALSWLIYALMAWRFAEPDQTAGWLLGYGLASIAYLILCRRATPLSWPLLLLAAAAARLLFCAAPLWLSDDLYRYLLDGRVLAAGLHPFRYPPSDPLIQAIAPELAARVNHPDIPTIYPPTVQLLSYVAALLHWQPVAWRLCMSGCDLLAMFGISRLFGGGDAGRRAAMVYALCPLAIVESASNGHLEALLNFCFVSACALERSGRRVGAAFALAAAILCKFTPAFAAAWWWTRPGGKRLWLGAIGIASLGLLAFARPGLDLWAALRVYLAHWSFNGPVYALLHALQGPERWLRLLPFLWLAVASLHWARRPTGWPDLAWLYLGFLLLSPTIHPWYALWLLPWLGPRPAAALWGFVLLMGFGYAVHIQVAASGEYRLPPAMAAAIWGPVSALLAQHWWRRRPAASTR